MLGNGALSLEKLAERLSARLVGDGKAEISRLATLQSAKRGALSFLANPSYRKNLPCTQATAVLIKEEDLPDCPTNALVVDDPYLAYAQLSHLFECAPIRAPGIHAQALIGESVSIGKGVYIGPNAVLEDGVCIGDGVIIEPGCVVGARTRLGEHTYLHANVTIYHGVTIGSRCNIHSGAVIGSDGFGFAYQQGEWFKIAQIGGVVIGDDVDVGANTTIDRGALDDTRIDHGVILDNQIQLAHNVSIGAHTAIAGCVGIAGSTKIGKNCTIAGGVGIAGHLTICDNVHISMMAQVTKSITEQGAYSSGLPHMPSREWKRTVGRLKQLERFFKRVKVLERTRREG